MPAILIAVMLLLAPAASPSAAADANHERARQAVEAGEAKPLAAVLEAIRRQHPGRALDAKLESGGDRLVYRIKWLGDDGKVRDIRADARTGQILEMR